MDHPLAQFDHPAWLTALATAIGYGVILVILAIVLFGIPLVLFTAL